MLMFDLESGKEFDSNVLQQETHRLVLWISAGEEKEFELKIDAIGFDFSFSVERKFLHSLIKISKESSFNNWTITESGCLSLSDDNSHVQFQFEPISGACISFSILKEHLTNLSVYLDKRITILQKDICSYCMRYFGTNIYCHYCLFHCEHGKYIDKYILGLNHCSDIDEKLFLKQTKELT